MTLRVGRIPYLHSEPFYFDMARRGIALYDLVPSALVTAVEHGEIDAGPLPLADCFRLANRLQPVAGFCLASVERTGSTLLYSTRPIEALDGAQIAISDEAATAPRLLHALLRLQYQVQPGAYVAPQAAHDAFLVIGDQGLRQRYSAPGFPYRYDLAEAWHAWTGLPCVFARWMVRQDIAPRELALLEDTLYVGLEEGVDLLYRIAEPREDLLMLPRDIVRYVRGFRYYVGLAEQQAIERFQQCLQQLEG